MEIKSSNLQREALMKRKILSAFFLVGFALLASIAHAAADEFFKGKTIRLVVGTSAGGAGTGPGAWLLSSATICGAACLTPATRVPCHTATTAIATTPAVASPTADVTAGVIDLDAIQPKITAVCKAP